MNYSRLGNLILIGPMGAGKTTIGRNIAANLGYEFYDSDKVIEERTGVNIPLIFELEGEQGFRKREQDVIADLTAKKNIVLATGGGAVLSEVNRQRLKNTGLVIYLYAGIDQLLERTAKDKNRPLLQTDNPREKLQQILAEREPIYRSMSDIILETNKFSVHAAVSELEALLKDYH